MIYYTINITFTEVELFTIKYSINQAVQVQDTIHIIITDTIHSARRIFDFLSHSYQLQSIAISQDLRVFFSIKTLTILSTSGIALAMLNKLII